MAEEQALWVRVAQGLDALSGQGGGGVAFDFSKAYDRLPLAVLRRAAALQVGRAGLWSRRSACMKPQGARGGGK